MSLPVLFSLGESNLERLGNDDPPVHRSDGFGCLLRRREATETEALAPAFLVHHLGAGDCPVGSKLFPKPLIVNGVVKVLDVEVDALGICSAFPASAARTSSSATADARPLRFRFRLAEPVGFSPASAGGLR